MDLIHRMIGQKINSTFEAFESYEHASISSARSVPVQWLESGCYLDLRLKTKYHRIEVETSYQLPKEWKDIYHFLYVGGLSFYSQSQSKEDEDVRLSPAAFAGQRNVYGSSKKFRSENLLSSLSLGVRPAREVQHLYTIEMSLGFGTSAYVAAAWIHLIDACPSPNAIHMRSLPTLKGAYNACRYIAVPCRAPHYHRFHYSCIECPLTTKDAFFLSFF